MAFAPKIKQRIDTRGLPEGYDPQFYYEYKTAYRSVQAQGLEMFVYKLVPYSLIRSFAFAIDPFSQFKRATGVITPINRLVTRKRDSVLNYRRQVERFHVTSQTSESLGNGYYGALKDDSNPYPTETSFQRASQVPLEEFRGDTSRKDRLLDSDHGEFEKFKHTISSPPIIVYASDKTDAVYPSTGTLFLPNGYEHHRRANYTVEVQGPGARLLQDDFDTIKGVIRLKSLQHMQENALRLYKDSNPSFRRGSVFRDFIELKDLPRSISNLKETARNLRDIERQVRFLPWKEKLFSTSSSIRDIPKEYVGYHFGWKLLLKSIKEYMALPNKIAKQINYLARRHGKDTTVRTTFPRDGFMPFDLGPLPGFTYDRLVSWESLPDISTSVKAEAQLRMVINLNIRFPDANVPSLNQKTFADLSGGSPRPTDLYNLIPWTWLIDWFSGAGNYLEMIESVARDESIINYGFLTCNVRGTVMTNKSSRFREDNTRSFGYYSPVETYTTYVDHRHSSAFDFNYQIRKDIAGLLDVRTTSDKETLSSYQKSILGALLYQRIKAR